MTALNDLADELSEADLAVFGVEDREEMAAPTLSTIGYSLDSLPDRTAFLIEFGSSCRPRASQQAPALLCADRV